MRVNNFFASNHQIDIKSDDYKKVIFLYNSVIKELKTKIEILNDEYKYFHEYEPIEYVTTRLKSPESILGKLKRKNYELTYENMLEKVNDIAGIRIVCNFKDDVYNIVEAIENFQDIRILEKKDFMKKPKSSGYMSYHMIVELPISFSKGVIYVKAEIQVRTLGMDFWANLEHKLKYKNSKITKKQSKELEKYAKVINNIDENMLLIANKNLEKDKLKIISDEPSQVKQIAENKKLFGSNKMDLK